MLLQHANSKPFLLVLIPLVVTVQKSSLWEIQLLSGRQSLVMKASVLSVFVVSFFQLASAQPHRKGPRSSAGFDSIAHTSSGHHAHKIEHIKKDVVTLVETYIAEATAVPNIVV